MTKKANRKLRPVKVEETPEAVNSSPGAEEIESILKESQSPQEAEELLQELVATKKKLPPRYSKRDWSDDAVITVIRENPKRGKSKDRYALYHTGMTVAEYVQAVVDSGLGGKTIANADLRWDTFGGRKGGANIAIEAGGDATQAERAAYGRPENA